jgi:DNA-binding XRE family transcriptional regulator
MAEVDPPHADRATHRTAIEIDFIVVTPSRRDRALASLSPEGPEASENEIHRPWYERQHSRSFSPMDVRHRLAGNMKRLRKERGWSQEALADEAGLDRTYISGIERVVRNPTITVIERVASALKCQMGDLLD